jgi:hypothetical protein
LGARAEHLASKYERPYLQTSLSGARLQPCGLLKGGAFPLGAVCAGCLALRSTQLDPLWAFRVRVVPGFKPLPHRESWPSYDLSLNLFPRRLSPAARLRLGQNRRMRVHTIHTDQNQGPPVQVLEGSTEAEGHSLHHSNALVARYLCHSDRRLHEVFPMLRT